MSEKRVPKRGLKYDIDFLKNHDVYYYNTKNEKVELGRPSSCGPMTCKYGEFEFALGGYITLYYDHVSSSKNASSRNASGKKRRKSIKRKSNKKRK